MQKNEITEVISQLKPVNWVVVELKNGLKKRGLFILGDKEALHINEQRVMATGLMYEGKAGQVPQMVRTKIPLAELVSIEKAPGRGGAGGSKASKGAKTSKK